MQKQEIVRWKKSVSIRVHMHLLGNAGLIWLYMYVFTQKMYQFWWHTFLSKTGDIRSCNSVANQKGFDTSTDGTEYSVFTVANVILQW